MTYSENHYKPTDDYIQQELKKAFNKLDAEINPNGESIMCSIHDLFDAEAKESHNCIGCNLAEFTDLLRTALQNEKLASHFEAFSNTIIYSYLLIERFEEIFRIIQLPTASKQRHFQIFGKIRRWANFIKHPKAFMFVHHPRYVFVGDVTIEPTDKDNYTIVDQIFIDKYYADTAGTEKLYPVLTNKNNVTVILPRLDALIGEFCDAQKKFVDIIAKNEIFRELLNDKSTLKDHFMQESLDS